MRIRKFFGCLFLATGLIGVCILLIDYSWTEPSETPAQIQELVIYFGFVLSTLLTLLVGFKLFTNETPDVQTLELKLDNPDRNNRAQKRIDRQV